MLILRINRIIQTLIFFLLIFPTKLYDAIPLTVFIPSMTVKKIMAKLLLLFSSFPKDFSALL